MRLGPLEIVLIILVVIAIAVIARIARSGRSLARHQGTTERETGAKSTVSSPDRLRGFLSRAGIVLVVGGLAAFIAAVSLFRMVLQGYLWAFVIMAAGMILLLYSRKIR
jgi:hypothetical protein